MNSLFQLDIPKRSVKCGHHAEPLVPGMDIYSLILEDESSKGVIRKDYCTTCWNEVKDSLTNQPGVRGYWKSKIEKRPSVEGSTKADRALSLLKALKQVQEPSEAEIFVLCLFLSHARQIVLRQEFQQNGTTYHLYEIVRKDEFLTVKVVNLSLIQIEALQKSLADQLQSL